MELLLKGIFFSGGKRLLYKQALIFKILNRYSGIINVNWVQISGFLQLFLL